MQADSAQLLKEGWQMNELEEAAKNKL